MEKGDNEAQSSESAGKGLTHAVKTIRWAPVNIPFRRRLQTLAVLQLSTAQLFSVTLTLFILLTPLFWLFLPYFIYVWLDKTPSRGGRKWQWFRRLGWWKHLRDYFPARLIKTADLPPDVPYVFGYHPHGIISLGVLTNFCTEASGFEHLFPGIDLRPLTLSTNFRIPFFRDYILAMGACDVSAESCNSILKKGPGNAIMIVVGGAAEALDAHPGSYVLTLTQRKGFVKIALKNGAHLVPVFSFGETDVYDQLPNPEGSPLRTLQSRFQKFFGFTVPFFHGRGIFNYDFGLLPYRRPINTVVGKPIPVPKVENPTNEQVNHYHKLYMQELSNLFDTYKEQFSVNRTTKLVMKM